MLFMWEQNRHGNEDINKGCRSIFNDPLAPEVGNWIFFVCLCLSFLLRICVLLWEWLVNVLFFACTSKVPHQTCTHLCEWETERCRISLPCLYLEDITEVRRWKTGGRTDKITVTLKEIWKFGAWKINTGNVHQTKSSDKHKTCIWLLPGPPHLSNLLYNWSTKSWLVVFSLPLCSMFGSCVWASASVFPLWLPSSCLMLMPLPGQYWDCARVLHAVHEVKTFVFESTAWDRCNCADLLHILSISKHISLSTRGMRVDLKRGG